MDNDIIKENFDYYKENLAEIMKEYLNKFIIVKDKKVMASFDSFEEALKYASERYDLGTFIIQECKKNLNDSTQTFHSRVIVRNENE